MRTMRRIAMMSAALFSAITLAVTGFAGPAMASTSSTIYNVYGDLCLNVDLRHGAVHNGTKVQMWECNSYSNEQWRYFSDHTIRSSRDGRCLEAARRTAFRNGGKVQVWGCHVWDNQQWTVYSDGTIVNWYSGLCLDAARRTAYRNGGTVQMWRCNGWDNQQWVF